MSRLSNLLEPESGKCAVVLRKLNSGLKLQDLQPVSTSNGLGDGKELPSYTTSTVRRCDGNLPDIDAIAAHLRKRTPDESLTFGCDDERLRSRLCAQLVDTEAIKRRRWIDASIHVGKRGLQKKKDRSPVGKGW